MSRHSRHYFDLNPRHQKEPTTWSVILGAAFALLTLWVCTVFLFTL
jgi:hypothetical protein